METYLYIDTETFATVPINVGTYAYAEHATVELLSYKRSDETDTHIYEPDIEDMPADFRAALEDPSVLLVAHNVPFDRTVMRIAMGVDIPIERWRCSMALARSLGLPGALDKLGVILGLDEDKQKLKDGKALVHRFCKPAPKKSKVYRYDRNNSPAEWARYKEYNLQDTITLEEVWNRLPKWNYRGYELETWFEDQRINDYGVKIDIDMVERAIAATAHAQQNLNARMAEETAGLVTTVGKRDALLNYMRDGLGFEIDDLKGSTVESLLDTVDLPEEVRDLLYLRIKGTKTSTAKYKKIKQATSADGKLRGTILWCGAARTGRDCLAEGTPVLVRDHSRCVYEKPIENVAVDDEVWDGIEWVHHEGVVFSGDKEVITHDGVTATREHVVFLSDSDKCSLGEAADRDLALWRGEKECVPTTS